MYILKMFDKNVNITEELDIEDRRLLQEQINTTREALIIAIDSLDKIHKQINNAKSIKANLKKQAIIDNPDLSSTAMAKILNANDSYCEQDQIIEALQSSMEIIKYNINFLQSDMQILRSSMYSK